MPERRWFAGRKAVVIVVAGHLLLLVCLVAATRLLLGFEGALTTMNQITWAPLMQAQVLLLAVYLGLGGGPAWGRLSLSMLGVATVGSATRTAHLLLATSPPSYLMYYVDNWYLELVLYLLLEVCCVGFVLLALRLPWGALQGPHRGARTTQFRLTDLFALMTVVAVAALLLSRVHIDLPRMLLKIAAASLGMAGAVYVFFHRGRTRWFGLMGLFSGLVGGWFIWPVMYWSDILSSCITYTAVVLTLVVLRGVDFRLRGGRFSECSRPDETA